MLNIAFAKIGKSIKFKKNNYSPVGGDNEPSATLRALANHNPDKTFYIVGRSDFSTLNENEKLDLFPYDNVIDIWEGVKRKDDDRYYRHIITYFESNEIILDYAIMMIGQIGTVTVPDRIQQVKNRQLIASVIDMTKGYTTPISVWLNETKIPYVEIINDPRYKMNQSRDMFHLPTISIGQYDFDYTASVIRSYEDQDRIDRIVASRYAGMEKAFCVEYNKPNTNFDRDRQFVVILNQGNPSRYNLLKEWILDYNEDVEVYGKWDDDIVLNDNRFKGSLHIDDVQKKLSSVRCTFIIPIAKGWVTSKYIEMIHAGVIPFFHPTYDEQNHLDMPDFFRPDTPKELQRRIDMINNNDDYYLKSIQILQNKYCSESVYDGSELNMNIMKNINPDYVPVDRSSYQKKEATTLDHFFN